MSKDNINNKGENRRAFLGRATQAAAGLVLAGCNSENSEQAASLSNSYYDIAKALNPKRDYVFVDVGELRRTNQSVGEFHDALENTINTQLKAQGISEMGLTYDCFNAASAMKGSFDGDARIFKTTGGREVALVYWTDNSRSTVEFIRRFGSIEGKLSQSFVSDTSLSDYQRAVVLHEIGHASSPERNAANTSVRFETGPDGLLANHRSELRAEIIEALLMIREGNLDTAQKINDMRAHNFFKNVGSDAAGGERIASYMEYYVFTQVQDVINTVKSTGKVPDYKGIAELADKVSVIEDIQLQNSRVNGDGGVLEKMGKRLASISNEAGGDIKVAIENGLLNPQKDKKLIESLTRAY